MSTTKTSQAEDAVDFFKIANDADAMVETADV